MVIVLIYLALFFCFFSFYPNFAFIFFFIQDGKNEEWHFEKYKGLDDLLNEIEGNGPVPLSPNTIRKNCDRMMDHVRENGCQFDITNNMFDLAEVLQKILVL